MYIGSRAEAVYIEETQVIMRSRKPVKPVVEKLDNRLNIYQATRWKKLITYPEPIAYSVLISFLGKKFDIVVPVMAKTFYGESMKVILPETVSTTIYRYGFYELGLTKFILNYLKPGMIFFDVGSHFGYFSLLASHLLQTEGEVHLFEPTRSTFKIAAENTGARKNVILNNLAVWSCNTTIPFNDFGVQNCAFNSVRSTARYIKPTTAVSYNIEAISLDSYVETKGIKPDFIKIDAESAEYEILKGMQRILSEIKPILTVEVGDLGVEDALPSRELIDYILAQGYQVFEFSNGRIQTHEPRNSYDYDNLLFIPEI